MESGCQPGSRDRPFGTTSDVDIDTGSDIHVSRQITRFFYFYRATVRHLVKEEDVQFLKAVIGDETADAKIRGVLSAK